MIGAALGAAASLASAWIGARQSRKQAEAADKERARQQEKLDEWYTRRSNEDVMQLADVQAALSEAREQSKEQIAAARGRAAVMGGSQQEATAAQDSAARMLGQTARAIAATGTARKDAADEAYRAGEQQLSTERINVANQRNAAIAQAASAGIKAGMDMVGADAQSHLDNGRGLFEVFWKNKQNETQTT